jgi:hypothetical protein
MTLHVGFTGTQNGMTPAQEQEVSRLIYGLADVLHHGDCVGADAQAHALAKKFDKAVWLHPPENDSKRAWSTGSERVREPLPYLQRNRAIVVESDVMVAAPAQKAEQLRSGTWATVRYARKCEKPLYLVFPDGSVEFEDADSSVE